MNDGNVYKLPPKTLKRSKRWTNEFIEDTGKNIFICVLILFYVS